MKPLKILFADDDLKYSMLLKRFLEKEGYEVTCILRGLGELEPIQKLFTEHAQAAIDTLK